MFLNSDSVPAKYLKTRFNFIITTRNYQDFLKYIDTIMLPIFYLTVKMYIYMYIDSEHSNLKIILIILKIL